MSGGVAAALVAEALARRARLALDAACGRPVRPADLAAAGVTNPADAAAFDAEVGRIKRLRAAVGEARGLTAAQERARLAYETLARIKAEVAAVEADAARAPVTRPEFTRKIAEARGRLTAPQRDVREAEQALAGPSRAWREVLALAAPERVAAHTAGEKRREAALARLRLAEAAVRDLEDVSAVDRLKSRLSDLGRAVTSALLGPDTGRSARIERETQATRAALAEREGEGHAARLKAARAERDAARAEVAAAVEAVPDLIGDLVLELELEPEGEDAPCATTKLPKGARAKVAK